MRRPVSVLAAAAFALSLGGAGVAMAAPAVPLVALSQGSAQHPAVELVKKRKSEGSDSDGGEKGWFDYLKMSLSFADDEVTDEVKDGRIVEHLLGGLLSGLGGHIWAPSIAYKDVDPPPAAMTLGIVSTIMAWWWLPFILYAWIPWIGWFFGLPPLVILAVTGVVFNVWFIPRALQFAYSDAYAAGGGGGSKKKPKKKRKSSDDDDDE